MTSFLGIVFIFLITAKNLVTSQIVVSSQSLCSALNMSSLSSLERVLNALLVLRITSTKHLVSFFLSLFGFQF